MQPVSPLFIDDRSHIILGWCIADVLLCNPPSSSACALENAKFDQSAELQPTGYNWCFHILCMLGLTRSATTNLFLWHLDYPKRFSWKRPFINQRRIACDIGIASSFWKVLKFPFEESDNLLPLVNLCWGLRSFAIEVDPNTAMYTQVWRRISPTCYLWLWWQDFLKKTIFISIRPRGSSLMRHHWIWVLNV